MTNLKQGKLLISYDDIREYMGLTEDTRLLAEKGHDGIEIHVVASDDNNQDWLTNVQSDHWNIRRVKVELPKKECDSVESSATEEFMGGLINKMWEVAKEAIKENQKEQEEKFKSSLRKELKGQK